MQTLSHFIAGLGITMSAEWADSNPNLDSDPEWSRSANHWKCTFRRHRRRMTIYFSQGSAITREPQVADVLDCIVSDAACIENSKGFEDWSSQLGYDADSRKAERTFLICKRQAGRLRQFLGSNEAYESLLWRTERL